MLDLILVYRLMRALAERVRLLLVGDPFQLPPIGPGLVFHVLAESNAVPQQELSQVHRQAAGSSIPTLAQEIRKGRVPVFDHFAGPAPGVAFIEAASRHLTRTVVDVRQALADHGEVQILAVTKRGEAGVETLNAAIHKLVAADRPGVPGWGFAETEPVIHLLNDYDRDLFNGSLGRIRLIVSARSEAGTLSDAVECDFDGVVHRFGEDSMDRLELAHAITVHKAQGSQFQRVIIPVVWSRLLDRTLIYTALTRCRSGGIRRGPRGAGQSHCGSAPLRTAAGGIPDPGEWRSTPIGPTSSSKGRPGEQ
jgi:exodeoxyribonuclease V alpha subunit